MAELRSRLTAETLGAALLLAIVIGSGIMAERLAGGNAAIALFVDTAVTVGGLYVLTEALGPISGAHFNPVASAVMTARGELHGTAPPSYIVAQVLGTVLGAWLVHATFDMILLQFSTKVRSGTGQWIAETVVIAGLLLVTLRAPDGRVASMVTAYVGAAYWFAASTSFANSAAAFRRMFSNSFAGIAPGSVSGFVLVECVGAVLDVLLYNLLEPYFTATGHSNVIESSDEHPPHT